MIAMKTWLLSFLIYQHAILLSILMLIYNNLHIIINFCIKLKIVYTILINLAVMSDRAECLIRSERK